MSAVVHPLDSAERGFKRRGQGWGAKPALRTSAAVCGALLAVVGCAPTDSTTATTSSSAPKTSPPEPGPSLGLPPGPPRDGLSTATNTPQPTGSAAPDVTQQAAGHFVPAPGPPAAEQPAALPGPTALAPGVDYADPLAVARAYMAARLTYRLDDPAGYTAALTSPAFTTAAFAARSVPSASALGRLTGSQETSAVEVGGAELAGEAPNTASTRYVVVTCSVTTTYRGGGDTTDAAWTVRLQQAAPGQWRVDGVLSAD